MINIKTSPVFDDNDKQVGVVISAKDFEQCLDLLEDYYDYQIIQKRKDEPVVPFEKVLKTLKSKKK